MPRWIASRLSGLPCRAAIVALILVGPGGIAQARYLSSGIFSDPTDADPADPLDPTTAPPVNPFAGMRAPDTKIANVVSPSTDPLVANVEGHPIYLSELGDAVQTLPEQLQKMPFEVIYPLLLDRMVDHEALVLMARRERLDDDPKVRRQIDTVTGRVLEGALLERTAVPQVTQAAIRARYEKDYGGKPSVEEVHARHILVSTEADAKRLIAEADKGADFATLARRFSKDPDAARGGDLGFFRRDQVWPAFANLAFSLKPGEVAQTPISNEFGWHVVQVLERRVVPPPTFDEVKLAISKQLLREAVQRVIAQAREGLRVRSYNMNGTPIDGGPDNSGIGPMLPGYVPSRNGATGAPDTDPAATSPFDAAPSAPSPSAAPQNTGN
jgi:peptidyl-prolyl cis-trans isomerase C